MQLPRCSRPSHSSRTVSGRSFSHEPDPNKVLHGRCTRKGSNHFYRENGFDDAPGSLGIVRANGGEPAKHVSHRTTMLVIGVEGWPLLPDGQVSRKPAAAAKRKVFIPMRARRFGRCWRLNPIPPGPISISGTSCARWGFYGRREEYLCPTAAKIEPGLTAAWFNLATVQEEQGKTVEAIANYRATLAKSPDHVDGHFNLALCYEKADCQLDARRHWFAYLELDSTSPSALCPPSDTFLRPPAHESCP